MKKSYKKSWCYTCKGCDSKKVRYYYCNKYFPKIINQLNFIDEIIKKWEDSKR